MATAEKIASGGDWYISLWTADARVWVQKNAACMLCRKAHEQCGSSWNGQLLNETIGHIQSAGCLGQKEVVTAATNACIWELATIPTRHAYSQESSKERISLGKKILLRKWRMIQRTSRIVMFRLRPDSISSLTSQSQTRSMDVGTSE